MPDKVFYYEYARDIRADATGSSVNDVVKITYQAADHWIIRVRQDNAAVDLSAAIAWRAAVDTDFDHGSAPCVRVLNADIDSSDAANGNISLVLDANTSSFQAALGTSESMAGYFELVGCDAAGKQIFYFRFAVALANCLDPSGGDPPEPAGNHYTKTEVDALLAAKLDAAFTLGATTYKITPVEDSGLPTLGFETL